MKDFLKRVIEIREQEQFEARQKAATVDDWGHRPRTPCKICGRPTVTAVSICTTHREYHNERRKYFRERRLKIRDVKLREPAVGGPCRVCGRLTVSRLEICTTHPEYEETRREILKASRLEKLRAEWRARVNARNSKI